MSGPDPRRYVGVCMACGHWQVDIRAGAVSDLGGAKEAFRTIALVATDHLDDCVGGTESETVLLDGRRVQRPVMSDGTPATGALAMTPLPAWWVTR